MSYFEQKLGDLKVSVGAGVVKRNQTATEETLELETLRLRDRQDFLWARKRLTLCPWRERRLRAGGAAERCGLGCIRQPGAAAWTVKETRAG